MLVSPADGGVHRDVPAHVAAGIRHCKDSREDPFSCAVHGPPDQAFVRGLKGPELLWQIAPGRAGAVLPRDDFQGSAVIGPSSSTDRVVRHQRLGPAHLASVITDRTDTLDQLTHLSRRHALVEQVAVLVVRPKGRHDEDPAAVGRQHLSTGMPATSSYCARASSSSGTSARIDCRSGTNAPSPSGRTVTPCRASSSLTSAYWAAVSR